MPALPAIPTPQPRWLIPVLVVVVSMMVGGGLLARELYRLPDTRPAVVLALPTSITLAPDQQPGPGIVELTPDAAAHPQHENVRSVLQAYFDAINNQDYEAWKATVTKARFQNQPKATWEQDFATTRDGSILVYRIEVASDKAVRAFVGFTSTQDPSAAPEDLPGPCLRWKLVLPLTLEANRWRVDTVSGLVSPEHSRC
ncbi:MAG TPA: hypothetical protein VJT49_27855 [Amycolatopsis sp.]|uniref:hypothetical protein n=1 Tax=Amycolatopsis sp. TaxID=37632 RepID=UPI002B47C383|nr:hypothetical protein [Amycolatopsis sp.]HKS48856.1 hypothetical protein [Amycolatopsis sp.]